ncbi:MAG: DUF4012 domain-containing protein [Ktedonobacterales bacterium]
MVREASSAIADRAGSWGHTAEYRWIVIPRQPSLLARRGGLIAALLIISLLLVGLGSAGLAYAAYQHVQAQASVAFADLRVAQTDLTTLETNPFDTTAIAQAQSELQRTHFAYGQMNATIQHIPAAFGLTPIVGSDVSAVLQIGPIAVEVTQAGVLGCQILEILAPKLKNPLAANIPGLTSADIASIDAKFNRLYSLGSDVLQQIQNLPPSAASLDPHLGELLTAVSRHLPEFAQGLADARNVVAVLPQLLGVGKPASYLLEVMDSTELRPGGGFIGNVGTLTLSGGRMQGQPQIKDVDLIDRGDDCDLGIPLPAQLRWFTSGCPNTLLLQDSNLDPDFPSNAQRALQLYNFAGGSALFTSSTGPITSLQGVVAITPQLIENALKLTGPVTVPYFNTSVTSTNLTYWIHYWQLRQVLGESSTEIDPSCGSSYRKAFTCYLLKAFLSKLGTLSAANVGAIGKLVVGSLRSKDIQIYLSGPGAEALLQHHDLASALNAPKSGDGLMVVDANIDGIKANNYLDYTWNDHITLDASGDATHHLILTYDYPATSGMYGSVDNAYPSPAAQLGCTTYACYQDYLRIYVPAGSTRIVLPSPSPLVPWQVPVQTSAFNMIAIGGLLYLPIGYPALVVSVSWTVPHAAVPTSGGWFYQYTIQKQAGISRPVDVELTLPSCARVHGTPQGFTTPAAQSAIYTQPALPGDVTLSLTYAC